MRSLALLAAGLGCCSCASTGALQTATPVPPGTWRMGFEGGAAVVMELPTPYCAGASPCNNPYYTPLRIGGYYPGLADATGLPALAFSLRRGLSDSADVGARATLSSLDVDGKVLFVSRTQLRLAGSLALGVRYGPGPQYDNEPGAPRLVARPGMLVGWASRHGEAVLSVTPAYMVALTRTSYRADDHLSVGGSLGYAFAVSGAVHLMPALVVEVPVLGLGPQPAQLHGRTALVQLLLGVLVD